MGRRTKFITEYTQTDRKADADRDNIVGMGTVMMGMVIKW